MSKRIPRRVLRLLLCLAGLIAIISIGLAVWIYRDLHAPVAHTKSNDYIEIGRGSAPDGIANRLVAEGVLRHKWPLLLYIKLTGSTKLLKAGEVVWHVDGRIALFSASKVDQKTFGNREYSNVASLSVPYDGQAGYLSVHVFYADDDYLETVSEILRSFTWPEKGRTRR